MCAGIWLFEKGLDITNVVIGGLVDRTVDFTHLLQLRNITFYMRIFNHMENSVLFRFLCVLKGLSLYDDCMLAVLHDKAVEDVLIHSVALIVFFFWNCMCHDMLPYSVYSCTLSLCLSY